MQPKLNLSNPKFFFAKIIAIAFIVFAFNQLSFGQPIPAKANTIPKFQMLTDNDAGRPNRQLSRLANDMITNKLMATCTTWTFSVVTGDPTMTTRPFRDGVVKTCAVPGGPCQTGVAGTFHYQIFQWTCPVAQCVTITYDATNANFSFVTVFSAPPNLADLCQNWVTDAGSSATAGTPIIFSFNALAATTYYFLVNDVGTLPANGTIQIDAANCLPPPPPPPPPPPITSSPITLYRDADGDGFGDPNKPLTWAVRCDNCGAVPGYVTNNRDCDDTNPLIYPGAGGCPL